MGKLYSFISALLIAVGSLYAAEPSGYEWWIDNDVSQAKSGSFTAEKLDLKIDTSDLPRGTHYFNCRLNTADGVWGAVYRSMFYSIGKDGGAIGYEYWFDNDHEGKETGTLTQGKKTFSVDVSSLTPGVHYFNCRLNSSETEWGSVFRQMVFTTPTGIDAAAYEYWIDDKYDSKVEGDIAKGSNMYSVGLAGLRRGLHCFNYRIRTGAGVWGSVYSNYFYIDPDSSFEKTFEYWLDDDYAERQTMTSASNSVSFRLDLSGFDKTALKPHFFNLRVYDKDYPEGSAFYRKLFVPLTGIKAPIIGYRHFVNDSELDYVDVQRQFVDSYLFDVAFPDSVRPTVKGCRPSFDGDKVFIAEADSVDYTIQIRTELGWAPPQMWRIGVSNDFSTTAVAMDINSKHTFTVPSSLEFAAMKFTSVGDSLYFRSDIPVALDIYKEGERVAALSPAQVKGMAMLKLESGEYFGVLHSVEDAEAKNFTLHLMDTPNQVPTPAISYEDETVTISCSRGDAIIRYTLDGKDPDEESSLYSEPFELKRNATVKAKSWVEGSDITPSAVAEYVVDTYKAAEPIAEFDLAKRLLTLTSETKDASIFYTHEYDPADSLGGVWTDYKDPIQIRKNGTVYSRATFDGYKDSDITVTEISTLPDSVPMPRIEFEKGFVTISCAEKDAEIHYTLDGTRPTGSSTLYSGAFPLRRNATVMAIAFVPGLDIDSSRIATRVVDSYKVATPKGSFDVKTRLLTLTCDTVGAAISYSFDKDGEWTAYSATERIRMRKNGTVYAKATFDGYNDSDVAEIVVNELPDYVIAPAITCSSDGLVTITCATNDAVIRYSFDEDQPTMESPVYEGAFTITRNTRVNAFAYVPDLDIEPSPVSTMLFDIFRVGGLSYDFNPESRQLTLGCSTNGATILYTSDPNGEWTEYTGPISIRKNCTLYAKAVRNGYYDSETVTITINSLADSVPVPEISFEDGMVDITCANKDAEIHYTVDDPDLSAASPVFSQPFALDRNATIRAFALIPGLDIEPSDTVTKVIDSFKVKEPTGEFSVETRTLSLSCETDDAKIFYSFNQDGEWTEYRDPISITRNRNVYAKATREGWNDSEVVTIQVTELANSIPTPEISFMDGMVDITCANKDAEIHYTVDDPDLSAASPVFTQPFPLDRNATIRSFALIPGLDIEPSDTVTKVIDSFKVKEPTGKFSVETRTLSLSCETDDAQIFYSFNQDGAWTEYREPISITRNRNVYAKATREGWNDSDVATILVTELANSVPAPEISFEDGMVDITCANKDAEIHYTVDDPNLSAASPVFTQPFPLDRNATIRAFALIPGLDIEPSDTVTKVIDSFKAAAPKIGYNGRYVSLTVEEPDATIRYSTDGSEPSMEYLGEFDAEGLCSVKAVAVKNGYKDSDITELAITRYADEEHAETSAEGLLASAFDWDDTDLPNNVEEFRIEGRLNEADYAFISSMEALRHLDLEKVADARIPENAFRDTRLISISLPEDLTECGDSILSGATYLSSVVWNSRTKNVGEGLTRGLANPNVLLYVPAAVSVSGRTDLNIVREGSNPEVTLRYGYPYHAVRNFRASRVSLTHEFTQTTASDTCRGWETIVLPFSPTEITHEVNGPIVPFTAWNQDKNGEKPFWLFSATADGWQPADYMEACVPYIISMPNNSKYVQEFNLGGKVMFSAENVDLGADSSIPASDEWVQGMLFEGTFMPVSEPTLHSLNVNSTEGGLQPGSKFVPGGYTPPFGAYVSGAAGRRAIPLFGDSDLVDVPLIVDAGLLIETPAPGVLRICSGRERHVAVTTATGVTLRTLHLMPGEVQTLEGLTRDLYIVAGRKVMVR